MNLFPKETRPYYVYAPSYTHTSSGVRTLHLLCHALNEAGYVAQLVPMAGSTEYFVNPNLNTPVAIAGQFHDPIVVYPDIVKGNPLNAKQVVRYLLAPAGAYGGDKEFASTDQIWGALPSIAENVLRIPVSDPNIFYMNEGQINGDPFYKRDLFSCFYSYKYDLIHKNKLLDITENENNRSLRLEGSLKEIANILRRIHICYLYENSSIITEAALCGCPVILVRTPYFNTIDPACMMGNVQWSDGEIVKRCDNYFSEYEQIMDNFMPNLMEFITKTQDLS